MLMLMLTWCVLRARDASLVATDPGSHRLCVILLDIYKRNLGIFFCVVDKSLPENLIGAAICICF